MFQADQLKSVPSSATESHIEGLEKYTFYTLRVVVFTDNGNGVASKPVTVRTDEDSKFNTNHMHDCMISNYCNPSR